ncbi:diaminopimelate decarboxylase [Candidatus Vidania fulgoroideorum]
MKIKIKKEKKDIKTPFFIYNKNKILKNSRKFFKKKVKPFYAIKANYNRKIIKILNENNFNFEVVSIGEILFLKKQKINLKKILFSGVCKERSEIKKAIKERIGFINIESKDEIILLKKVKYTKILVKVNLNIDVETNKNIKTCKENNKFGTNKKEFSKIIKYSKKKKINIYGLSFHLGSQIMSNKAYIKGFKKILEIVKYYKLKIKAINIGGGYSVKYKKNEKKHNLYCLRQIQKINKKHKYEIFVEPGRYIVADACKTVAKVIRIKKTKKKNIALVNIGMESIIRPALYGSFHKIENFCKKKKKKILYEISGPICESTDVLSQKVFLEKLKKNSYIVIKNTGAYCMSMRMSKYNMRNKPIEIFI